MDAAIFFVCLGIAGLIVFGSYGLRRSARNRELDDLRRNLDERGRAARPSRTDTDRDGSAAWQQADDGTSLDFGDSGSTPPSPCFSAGPDMSSSSCSSSDSSSSSSSSSD
jgi:hypothetical protein